MGAAALAFVAAGAVGEVADGSGPADLSLTYGVNVGAWAEPSGQRRVLNKDFLRSDQTREARSGGAWPRDGIQRALGVADVNPSTASFEERCPPLLDCRGADC